MEWKEKIGLTSLGTLGKFKSAETNKYLSLRPDRQRRLLIAMLAWLIACNLVFAPQRSDAAIPALLAAPEAALGVFVGVVAIGAIGMEVFGYTQQSDKAMAYARATWDSGQAVMKKAVIDSYNAAVSAGDKMMHLSADVADYWAKSFATILTLSGPDVSYTSDGITVSRNYSYSGSMYAPSAYYFVLPRGFYATVVMNNDTKSWYGAGSNPSTPTNVNTGGTWSGVRNWNNDTADSAKTYIQTVTGVTATIPRSVADVFGSTELPKIRDAFPLSLPVPGGQDFLYTPVANPGVDVHMRNDGTLADDAGKVYTPDQVQVKATPVPRIVTDAAGNPVKDATGKPVIGVPVGAVGVGDAAIPGTIVNVKTGEKVTTGDTTANPPLDWSSQPTTQINWGPLKVAAGAFTTKFPFSIPWDVGRQLSIFDVQPKPPVWHVDQIVDMPNFGTGLNNDIHFKWDFDLAFLDPYTVPLRWFVIIAADVGLMLSLRRFLPE